MFRRGPSVVAALILALMVPGVIYGIVEIAQPDNGPSEAIDQLMLIVAFASFGVVGALIVSRRPDNRMGWLFSTIGVLTVGVAPVDAAFRRVLSDTAAGIQPGGLDVALAVFAEGFWYPFFALFFVVVPLIYPTGRALSARWGRIGWLGAGAAGLVGLLGMLQPKFEDESGIRVINPIGIEGIPAPEGSLLGDALLAIAVVCGVLAFVSVVVRFYRADRIERLQIKWLMFTFGLLVGWTVVVDGLLVDMLGQGGVPFGDNVFALIVLAIPVSAGVAIFRYRLYEIDRIVSRTVAYALVVGLLAAVYAMGIFVLTRLMPATGDLAVAASTLSVAALFNPLRKRLQAVVDRRFNRSRYDAERLVDAFALRLRTEAGLPQIVSGLQRVVTDTVQPAFASIWVRTPT